MYSYQCFIARQTTYNMWYIYISNCINRLIFIKGCCGIVNSTINTKQPADWLKHKKFFKCIHNGTSSVVLLTDCLRIVTASSLRPMHIEHLNTEAQSRIYENRIEFVILWYLSGILITNKFID